MPRDYRHQRPINFRIGRDSPETPDRVTEASVNARRLTAGARGLSPSWIFQAAWTRRQVEGRHFSRTLIHSLGLLKSVSYGGRERCRWPTDQGGELPAIVE